MYRLVLQYVFNQNFSILSVLGNLQGEYVSPKEFRKILQHSVLTCFDQKPSGTIPNAYK